MQTARDESFDEREFVFTDKDFNKIRDFVKQKTGISLADSKKNLVYGRLSRRLRQLNLNSFSEYFKYASDDNSDELVNFINAVTTNLTAFFREEHHFNFVKQKLIPEILKRNAMNHRIRVWSAGCSTGEEPYSIAISLLESVPRPQEWDIKILATDLDTNVLAHGKQGVYDEHRIEGLSSARKKRWFLKGSGGSEGKVRVSPELSELITFKQLNLMEDWPMRGPFDFIFCRNVVIYFEKPTQKVLFDRYANMLQDDSYIFLGHSESLFKVSDRFNLIGNTIYQKIK